MDDLYKVYVYSFTDIMNSWSNNAILSVFAIILGQHQCRLPNNFKRNPCFNNVPEKYFNGSKMRGSTVYPRQCNAYYNIIML